VFATFKTTALVDFCIFRFRSILLVMEIIDHIQEEELQAVMDQVAKFVKDYGDLNIQICRKLINLYPLIIVKNEGHEQNRSDALPPIPLPTFNGNYSEFEVFCEQFEERVVPKTDIAESATDSFQLLWAALKSRYQVKRHLSESHINQLFAMKRTTRESELQRLLDVVGPAARWPLTTDDDQCCHQQVG
jgi:hypothetical protein